MKFLRIAAVAAGVCAAFAVMVQAPAFAQAPEPSQAAPPEPKFQIRGYKIDGATLITQEEIERALQPFTGANKDFADVQRALEVLERLYTSRGFSAVQVVLPEQDLGAGEVQFKVVEAKIGRLIVEGAKFFDEANIRASIPSVVPGRAPNIHGIADNLRVANESSAKQTTVLLRSGSEEGTVDVMVRVADENPVKYSVTLDNTGTEQTGTNRIGVGLQHSNLFNRDHSISMQYVTAPNDPDAPNGFRLPPDRNVTIFGAQYHIPFYSLGDSLDIAVGYSNVNSGIVGNLFNVSGAGTIMGMRYNLNLPKFRDVEQRVQFGLDWRGYRNKISQVENFVQIIPDVTVHPVSVTYLGALRNPTNETIFNLGVYQNLPGGNDGGSAAFENSRIGARPAYTLLRYGINHNRAFANDWQMRAAVSGQVTRDRLITGEQFGVGGLDSVRGYLEREVVNDYGYRGSVELYTPDFGSKVQWISGLRMRTVFFYDFGSVQRNEPFPTEPYGSSISSFGLGVRVSRGTNFSMRLDYGMVVDKGGLQNHGDGRVHASFAYIF